MPNHGISCSRCKVEKARPYSLIIWEYRESGDQVATCIDCAVTEDWNWDWILVAQIDFRENGSFKVHTPREIEDVVES